MKNPNFYENLEEAHRRLLGTVVLYDGEPVRILSITNHKSDGIFRMYLYPVKENLRDASYSGRLPRYQDFGATSPELGAYLDKWMEGNKTSSLLRKTANSPKFNQFRPFSLGMINYAGCAHYLERSPERRTQQGLVSAMVESVSISLEGKRSSNFQHLDGPEFHDCVKGAHPNAQECLENLIDPNVENTSVAFHRSFAFARGPLDLLFLSYKGEVVGLVPKDKRPSVDLGKKYSYLKETIEETKQFHDIRIRS